MDELQLIYYHRQIELDKQDQINVVRTLNDIRKSRNNEHTKHYLITDIREPSLRKIKSGKTKEMIELIRIDYEGLYNYITNLPRNLAQVIFATRSRMIKTKMNYKKHRQYMQMTKWPCR